MLKNDVFFSAVKIFHLLTLSTILVLMGCTSSNTARTTGGPVGTSSQTGPFKTLVYECSEGYGFTAKIEANNVWLFLSNEAVSLPLVPSASGSKYRDGPIMFWHKGDEALIEIGDKRHANCVNNRAKAIWEDAKLRGVDFRAVGNEPGWHMEITGKGKILFVGDYGKTRHAFDVPKPMVDEHSRKTTYKAKDGNHELTVMIDGRLCHDTMSGEAFDTAVTVILDGKKYRGCGRALH